MPHFFHRIALPLFVAFLAPLACAQHQSVRYQLSFPNAVHHEAEVRATFSGVRSPVLEIVMSRSSPGRYALHEFAKNIYNVRATDEHGRPLDISRPSPYGWNIAGHKGTVVFAYTLFGDRADGTYAAIDETHAHLNMPAALAWAHGFENAPVTLHFDLPESSNWKIATQLIPHPDGDWSAPDLEWLMDSPVEISNHVVPEWRVENATFRLSLHHQGSDADAADYAKMCEAVVLEEEGVFGGFPKYDSGTYTFLVDYLPYVSGDGMEHRDSTVITGKGNLHDSAPFLIGAVSHEFFHSWNVKRIRPKSLEPFDFERADMSGELWFAEGFTNYYGMLVLKRAGIWSMDQFVGAMNGALNEVLTAPGRKEFDVVDMSRLAPFVDAATSIDPTNQGNNFISYYIYGQALAFGIDLMIREQFPGKSLDDWMRTMWREHPDIDKPYTLADLERSLAETVGSADFAAQIFDRHIVGKEPLPYDKSVLSAGLMLKKSHPGQAWIGPARGLTFSDKSAELTAYSQRDSPLYNAGLDKGDRILDWDGKSFKSTADFNDWLTKHKRGDTIVLNVVRRDGPSRIHLTLMEDPALQLVTVEQAGHVLTPEISSFRASWLGSKAMHPLPVLAHSFAPK
ncbi:MAG: M61 family metallopeptidase [Acidobacteriaceae bacterium]|nr:M61 family metallopeptidase [Acidobacteriaceae bacterium]